MAHAALYFILKNVIRSAVT